MECPMYWRNLDIEDPIRKAIERWMNCKEIYKDDIAYILKYICALSPSFLSDDESRDMFEKCENVKDKESLGIFLNYLWEMYDIDIL